MVQLGYGIFVDGNFERREDSFRHRMRWISKNVHGWFFETEAILVQEMKSRVISCCSFLRKPFVATVQAQN